MIKRKKRTALRIVLSALACVLVLFQTASCDQAPLFADISNEVEPKEPRIPGSQTNIVIAKEESDAYIYVAGIGSEKIHKYREGKWIITDGPGETVIALASDGETLFALGGSDIMKARLYRKGSSDNEWGDPIAEGEAAGFSLQSIYGAGDKLFAGGRMGYSYSIFYFDENEKTIKSIFFNDSRLSGTAELKGAVESGGVYYIAAGSDGIFRWDAVSSSIELVPGSEGNVTGIMNISGRILAVTWSGSVLMLNAAGDSFDFIAGGPAFTGAMAVWKDSLLLLGVHTAERFNKGYRELFLDPIGTVESPGIVEPSSVGPDRKYQYDASIARNSIFSIIQVPDDIEEPADSGNPVIFATTVNGLHSLRNGEWNAEE